jgi:alkylation response protein AidB-like acyl-CoA dehydrogenase
MGRDGVDNGWIRFDKARIPRNNLLMRHITVDKDGTVRLFLLVTVSAAHAR